MSELSKNAQELKWIEEAPQQPVIRPPPIGEFELVGERTVKSTILKKAGENIFVPLGLIATTACLTLGLISFRKGDSKKQNFYMKGRVGFQAFTLGAMTIGMYLTTRKKER